METLAPNKVNSHKVETELSTSFPGPVLEKLYRYLKGLFGWFVHFGLLFPSLQSDGNTVIVHGRSNMRKQCIWEIMKRFVWKNISSFLSISKKNLHIYVYNNFLLSYVNWLLNSCKNSNEDLDSGVLLYLNRVYISPKIYLRQICIRYALC